MSDSMGNLVICFPLLVIQQCFGIDECQIIDIISIDIGVLCNILKSVPSPACAVSSLVVINSHAM